MAGDANRQGRTEGVPIEGVLGVSPNQLQALKSRWITTVDSLVAAAATKDGRAGLCSALSIEADALDDLLRDARVALGEDRYKELLAPRIGGPTGALIDGNQRRPTDEPAEGGAE